MTMTDTTTETTDSLEVATETATYTLQATQGKLAGDLAFAASTDTARPVLCSIRIRFNADTLELHATDSYVAAWRVFQVDEKPDYDRGTVSYAGTCHGEAVVNAKQFREAIAAAVKSVGGHGLIQVETGDTAVTVSGGGYRVELPANRNGTFPGIDQIISANAISDAPYAGTLPAINPFKLEQVRKATGLTKANFKLPLVWHTTISTAGSSTPELKPLRLTYGATEASGFGCLIMPVRI